MVTSTEAMVKRENVTKVQEDKAKVWANKTKVRVKRILSS